MTVYECLCWAQSVQCLSAEDCTRRSMEVTAWKTDAENEVSQNMNLGWAIEAARRAQALSIAIDALPIEVAESEV